MDQEVVSIGGSSSEDTCHSASDNESSLLERLRVLCHIGGGTTRLHRRAQLSAASLVREPVPVTAILPRFVSERARRSSGGDARVSSSPLPLLALNG